MELAKKSKLAASINNDLKYVTISKVVERSFEEIFQEFFEEWKTYTLDEIEEGYLYYDKRLNENTLVTQELYEYSIERYRDSLKKRLDKIQEFLEKEAKKQEKTSESQEGKVVNISDYRK